MDIKVEFHGLKEVIANLDDLAKTQLPIATAKGLTKTAQDVQAEEIKQMQSSLDRPTPYTLQSLFVKPATKAKLEAMVAFKDKSSAGKGNPAANWMQPQAEGGRRNVKRFESALQRVGVLPKGMYIVPGSACPLDAYGNIPSSLIVQILSYFQTFYDAQAKANMKDKRKASMAKGSKRKGTMGFEYFVSYGKGTRSGRQNLPAGIYKRFLFTKGSAIKPFMMFVKQPAYQKRFPFYEIGQKIIDRNLINNFDEAMKDALLTMKRTG